jgi:hypothetical protein
MAVRFDGDRFVVHSFAGQDWRECRDHVGRLLGLDTGTAALTPVLQSKLRPRSNFSDNQDEAAERTRRALGLWSVSTSLTDTLGWRYFTERRELRIGLLDPLDHCLRWHEGENAVVALMTDPLTNEPVGLHRTYLDKSGCKITRKMLGKAGIVRLSPDETVNLGLGLTEGVEDGLAVLLSGWAPVWAATSGAMMAAFPTPSAIESLTLFHDADKTGTRAAETCAQRWTAAGCQARLSLVKDSLQ